MATKAGGINGMFQAKALIDIDSSSAGAASYTTAITEKSGNSFVDVDEVTCWPMLKLGDYKFHMSTQLAGLIAQVDTGNQVLDAMLTAKRMQALEGDVEVSYIVDGSLLDFIEPLDLTALLGNALDNAIEAAMRLPEGRLVHLAVFAQDSFVMVRVENTFDGTVHRRNGRLVTRKREPGHGYGLRNIQAVAERYDGSVSTDTSQQWFALRVLFPLPATPHRAGSDGAGRGRAGVDGAIEP